MMRAVVVVVVVVVVWLCVFEQLDFVTFLSDLFQYHVFYKRTLDTQLIFFFSVVVVFGLPLFFTMFYARK